MTSNEMTLTILQAQMDKVTNAPTLTQRQLEAAIMMELVSKLVNE